MGECLADAIDGASLLSVWGTNELHTVHKQNVKWERLVIRIVFTLRLNAIEMNFRTNQDNLRQ